MTVASEKSSGKATPFHDVDVPNTGEAPQKVTLLLPLDTVKKLDEMSRNADIGSRGRVITALVDTVWDSGPDIVNITAKVAELNRMQSGMGQWKPLRPVRNAINAIDTYVNLQQQNTAVTAVANAAGAFISRFTKFVKVGQR
jgi:hypothetical protein